MTTGCQGLAEKSGVAVSAGSSASAPASRFTEIQRCSVGRLGIPSSDFLPCGAWVRVSTPSTSALSWPARARVRNTVQALRTLQFWSRAMRSTWPTMIFRLTSIWRCAEVARATGSSTETVSARRSVVTAGSLAGIGTEGSASVARTGSDSWAATRSSSRSARWARVSSGRLSMEYSIPLPRTLLRVTGKFFSAHFRTPRSVPGIPGKPASSAEEKNSFDAMSVRLESPAF